MFLVHVDDDKLIQAHKDKERHIEEHDYSKHNKMDLYYIGS